MSEPQIGQWARRVGKWHLIDSVIADRVVTRCGKEMQKHLRSGDLAFSEVMPLTRMIGQPQLCRAGCSTE